MKIALIGVGQMGSAIYQGWKQTIATQDIALCEKDLDKIANLTAGLKTDDAVSACEFADIIVLGPKPQAFPELAEQLRTGLSAEAKATKCFVSIMAGVSVETIQASLGVSHVVRTMPNLPVQVGKGVWGYYSQSSVPAHFVDFFVKSIAAISVPVCLQSEDEINKITLLSGSGPAYFYYLVENLQQVAVNWGFDEEVARQIAEQTAIGSVNLLAQGDKSAAEWRAAVTSKGGTTEAALSSLAAQKFPEIFASSLSAGIIRARELGSK